MKFAFGEEAGEKKESPLPAEGLNFKKILLVVAGLIVLIVIFFNLYNNNPKLFETMVETYGLFGMFFVALIANATLLLPIPIDIFVFLLGDFPFAPFGILNPALLAFTVGLGAAMGEMSGYMMGLFGISSLEKLQNKKIKELEEMEIKINKHGMGIIALLALVPFPFDIIGMAAGLIKFPAKKFFVACFAGKTMRYLIISYAGYFSLNVIRHFFGF